MRESMDMGIAELTSLYAPWDVFHDNHLSLQDKMDDPIAFTASANPDILYYDKAMSAPDGDMFPEAMGTEVGSMDNDIHRDIIPIAKVPDDQPVLPAVWAFRRKRRITTNEVYKWKARLNIHGGRQLLRINYWETYAPVVGWLTIRLFLNLMIVNGWTSRQIDFMLAFPQADIECDVYMEVPIGFKVNGSRQDFVLKLKPNLYGQRQAERV
jgi:Reverse transcriptase (RNA-dependent DNA polymerase)